MSPVTEEARLHLYDPRQQQLGNDDAITLMTMLPPSGFDELVTKSDLRSELALLRSDLKVLRSDLRADLHETLGRQTAAYARWMLAGMVGLTAIYGAVVSFAG